MSGPLISGGLFLRYVSMLNFFTQLPVAVQAAGLLVLSNCFMTFAWYGHLKYLSGSAWYVAAVVSWSIALFEYLLQVPANRIGFRSSLWRSSRSCRR